MIPHFYKGDLLFVVVKGASDANLDELQNELNEHFEPQGVLAIATAFEIEMVQASVPKPGELLWISIEGGSEQDLAETKEELIANLDPQGPIGAVLVANFAPEVAEMDELEILKTRAFLDMIQDYASERRATIKMVFPQKSIPTPREDPGYHEQLARDNALFDRTESFMTEQLVEAGYVVPANMLDLIAEFVMACENPPVETASTSRAPTTIYAEDSEGNRTVLGTAKTWWRAESRDVDKRVAADGTVEALEPVLGSYKSTMVFEGFVPVDNIITRSPPELVFKKGDKVHDEDGNVVAELVDWKQHDDGRVEATYKINDDALADKIRGKTESFSIGAGELGG